MVVVAGGDEYALVLVRAAEEGDRRSGEVGGVVGNVGEDSHGGDGGSGGEPAMMLLGTTQMETRRRLCMQLCRYIENTLVSCSADCGWKIHPRREHGQYVFWLDNARCLGDWAGSCPRLALEEPWDMLGISIAVRKGREDADALGRGEHGGRRTNGSRLRPREHKTQKAGAVVTQPGTKRKRNAAPTRKCQFQRRMGQGGKVCLVAFSLCHLALFFRWSS